MLEMSTLVPTILKLMITVITLVSAILILVLIVKIYRGEARDEDGKPRNTGW